VKKETVVSPEREEGIFAVAIYTQFLCVISIKAAVTSHLPPWLTPDLPPIILA